MAETWVLTALINIYETKIINKNYYYHAAKGSGEVTLRILDGDLESSTLTHFT